MSLAKVIDGKDLAQKFREQLAKKIAKSAVKPVLAVVLVGDDEASKIYVRNKQKAALEAGIECRVFAMSANVTSDEVKKQIAELNDDEGVHGIILQLPMPKHINPMDMLKLIDCGKDVDGFCPYNAGLLHMNSEEAMVAATPQGVLYMLNSVCDDLSGKHAVIIGRSNIVGRPLGGLLLNQDCTVTITHSRTKNIEAITKQADILVAACGCPKLVKKSWVKEGAIVIDVGINRLDNKLCGDVDFDEVAEVASYISPVPGGVGPMTIAMLLNNTYLASIRD